MSASRAVVSPFPRAAVLLVAAALLLPAPGSSARASTPPDASPQAPPAERTVTFRVLDASGHPLPGAAARLYRVSRTGERGLLRAPTVGARGRLSVAVPEEGALLEVSAEGHARTLRWLVPGEGGEGTASGDGAVETLLLRSHPEVEEGAPPAPPGTRIAGRVTDARGRPVAAARVELLRLDFRTWTASPVPFHRPGDPPAGGGEAGGATAASGGEDPGVLELETGDDGAFELELRQRVELPARDRAAFEVVCSAPGFAAATVPVQPQPEQRADCRLDRQRTRIAGVVAAPGGEGRAWLPLTLMAPVPPAPWIAMVVSGPDGTFASAEQVPAAPEYVAVLNAPEARPQVVRVPPGEEGRLAVPVLPGPALRVAVAEAGGGPVEHARVRARVEVAPLTLEREARREDGAHTLLNLPPGGEVTLLVEAAGYLSHRATLPELSEDREVRVELEPAVRIAGRVTDGDGRPVPGARVTAVADAAGGDDGETEEQRLARRARAALGRTEGDAGGPSRGDQTRYADADGRFVLEGLVRGGVYHVSCSAEGYAPWWDEAVPTVGRGGDGHRELAVVLERGAVVEGRVLYDDGTPVEGARVRAVRVTADPQDPGHFEATPEAQRQAETDERGRYRLQGLATGSYVIGSDTEGLHRVGQFHFEVPPPLPLLAGDVLTDLDVYLPLPGRLRLWPEPELADLGPARVAFHAAVGEEPFSGPRIATVTLAEGADGHLLDGIAPGRYDLAVRFPGRIPVRFEGVEIDGGFETALEVEDPGRGRTLELTVVDEAEREVADAAVVLYRVSAADAMSEEELEIVTGGELGAGTDGPVLEEIPEGEPSLVRSRTGGDGHLRVAGLEPGSYQVHVTGEGAGLAGRHAYRAFRVEEGDEDEAVEQRVVLLPAHPVHLRVESVQGAPLATTKVVLTRRLPGFQGMRYEGLTGAGGEVLFPGLPGGLYRVELFTKYPAAEGLVTSRRHRDEISVQGPGEWVVRVP